MRERAATIARRELLATAVPAAAADDRVEQAVGQRLDVRAVLERRGPLPGVAREVDAAGWRARLRERLDRERAARVLLAVGHAGAPLVAPRVHEGLRAGRGGLPL